MCDRSRNPSPLAHRSATIPNMSLDLRALADAALDLDPADRLALASLLIDSVEDPADADWVTSWTKELHQRSAAADQRSVRGSSWSDVRARLLGELSRR